jgi:acyl-CoA synthetase (NDP forming)
MVKYLGQHGIGIHSALEFGTGAMLSMERLGLALVERDDVAAVAMYADGVGSLPDFAVMLARAEELGKSVVFMIGGASQAGSRAAASHSGMAATPRNVLGGLAEQHRAVMAATLDEVVWSIEAMAAVSFRRFDGADLALFSDSGGADIAMADAISAVGVEIVEPGSDTKRDLGLAEDSVVNPVDFGSQSMGKTDDVNQVIATVAADEAYGIAVFASILGLPRAEQSTHLGQIADFAVEVARLGKVPFVASLFPFLATSTTIDDAVIGMGSIESAVKLRALATLGRSAAPRESVNPNETASLASLEDPPVTGDEAAARLAALPLAWPRSATVQGVGDLTDAALPPYPVVVKTEARLAHRANAGGVLLGIDDFDSLRNAVEFMARRFGGPVSVTEMVAHRAAYFVGAFRQGDLVTILFGPGGAGAERAAKLRVSPISDAQWRAAAVPIAGPDADACIRLLRALEVWMAEHPEVESVDLNPVVVDGGTVTALDAKIQRLP